MTEMQAAIARPPAKAGPGEVGLAPSKELESLKALKYREGIWRLDMGPFFLLYAGVFLLAASYAAKYEW